MNRVRHYFPITLIIFLNAVFFIPMIVRLPGFILDDYYVFYAIDRNPSHFVSFNPHEYFFLFLRPLTYFSFWLDHIVFNFSSLQMKVESFILHILLITIFYYFLHDLLEYLKLKINPYILFLTTLIFSLHTVFVWQAVWISQRNELLMLLFYISACYMVLLYLMKNERYFLWLFLVFYILSVSAKQQSLHLPLAVLLLSVFYKKKLTGEEYRNTFRFSIAGIFIMTAYFAVNTFLYKDYGGYSFVSNFWKKPLSTAGTFLIAIVPNEAEKLYTYSLTHKLFAVVAFILLLISAGIIVYKYRAKNAVVFTLIFVLSFFPSAFAESSLRIIGIQVFLVYTLIALIFMQLSVRKVYIYAFLLILLVLNVNASIRQYSDEYQLDVFRKDYLSKLDEYFKANSPVNVFIVTAPYSIMLPYQYYFHTNHKFGKYPVAISPTGYSYNYKNFTEGDVKNTADTFVTVELSGSIVLVRTNRDYISNYLSISFPDTSEFEITEKIPDRMRGFKEVKFTIPERYLSFDKIYYNGVEWLTLSDPHIIKQNPKPGITDFYVIPAENDFYVIPAKAGIFSAKTEN